MMDKVKKGDHVRVVVEDEVIIASNNFFVLNKSNNALYYSEIKSIEVIPEPLKEGDYCWVWEEYKSAGHAIKLGLIEDGRYGRGYPYALWSNAEKLPPELAKQLLEFIDYEDM